MKTIEEIKEIIARKVAGQGNQIDLGGGVNEALNAICEVLENAGNGALIVEGVISNATLEFTPNAGQPSKQNAMSAFVNGTPVYLKESEDRMFAVTAVNDGSLYAFIDDAGVAAIYWEM